MYSLDFPPEVADEQVDNPDFIVSCGHRDPQAFSWNEVRERQHVADRGIERKTHLDLSGAGISDAERIVAPGDRETVDPEADALYRAGGFTIHPQRGAI